MGGPVFIAIARNIETAPFRASRAGIKSNIGGESFNICKKYDRAPSQLFRPFSTEILANYSWGQVNMIPKKLHSRLLKRIKYFDFSVNNIDV